MREVLFRCSAIGKLMTEPMTVDAHLRTPLIESILASKKRSDEEKAILQVAKERSLSVGAKTHVRTLVAQAILGIDFEIGSKPIEKGIEVEPDVTGLINRVRGLSLVKNTERRSDEYLTGECDLFDVQASDGYDAKASWSAATFPIALADCEDALYEWQMRGYMRLWKAKRWTVAYGLVNTPERLIGFEPQAMHFFDHIPPHHRLTTWTIEHDAVKEALMVEKIKAARRYYAEVVAEFDRTHRIGGLPLIPAAAQTAPQVSTAPAALPVSIFG